MGTSPQTSTGFPLFSRVLGAFVMIFPSFSSAIRLMPLGVAALIASNALLAPAALAAPSPSAKAAATAAANRPDYRLVVGDELQITVANHPDVDRELVVRPDGKITLPRVGDIAAAGKTATVLSAEIQRVLSRTLNNARVQVIVKSATIRQAVISGAVKAPGPYTFKSGLRVIDLIGRAGGLTTRENRVKGRVIRQGQEMPFDVSKAVSNASSPSNLLLRADDLVILDAQDYSKQLTVTGSVTSPGNYDLVEGLTVAGLLAQAGGVKPEAALGKAYVVRDDETVPLDLRGIESGSANANSPLNNFKFKLGDVLTVPANTDRVGVTGRVAQPNFYALPEDPADAKLLRMLALAGGPQTDADLSKVTLTRVVKGQQQITPIDVAAIQDGTAPDNMILRPDDVLFVPKRDSNVIISGAVGAPGSYPITDDETLLAALAKAGDPTKNASLRNVTVLRGGKQIPIDLRPVLVEGALDPAVAGFRLQSGDVIRVPDISDQVTVSGQIARPGVYNLSDDLTVVSLLAQAGNATDKSALSKAYVLRHNVKIPLDLNVFLSGSKDQPSLTGFRLKPGDALVIPENKVFYTVVGQVNAPGNFPYPDKPSDATVLRALVNAGGPTTAQANLSDAGVLREVGDQVTVIPVNLSLLFNKKQQDNQGNNIVLQPRDILFVPAKGRKFSFGEALGAALALRQFGGL